LKSAGTMISSTSQSSRPADFDLGLAAALASFPRRSIDTLRTAVQAAAVRLVHRLVDLPGAGIAAFPICAGFVPGD
jgi:hypothetical protein